MASEPVEAKELPDTSKKAPPPLIRVLLLGPHGSGKTALRRAALRQPFVEEYKPGFLSKHDTYMHINNTSVPVELWDATEDSWPAVTQLIVDVVILCLDISNPKSIEYIEKTEYFQALKKRQWDMPIIITGCKDDLRATKHARSLLDTNDVYDWAESNQLTYTECSAKNGDIMSVLRIVGMVVMNNDRRETLKTPAQLHGAKINFVEGIMDMSIARGFRQIFQAYSDRYVFGERMYDDTGDKLLRYSWTTYKQLGERVKNFGVGLRSLVPSRSFVCLCAENGVSWIVADMAMQIQNMVSVMVHYTLPDEDIHFIVSRSELDAVITAPHLIKAFAHAAATNPKLKVIILQYVNRGKRNPVDAEAILKECREISPNTTFLTQEQVEALGVPLEDTYVESTDPDEVFSISYTSGSTGRPKGIMMSSGSHRRDVLHETMIPSIGCVFEPLSHSERLNTYAKLCGGGRVTFFHGEMDELLEELQICGPTVFISVPRFWNVLYGEFNKVVALYRKHMPNKGPQSAKACARQLFESLMGGRLIYASTGGAPTSPAVLSWMHGFNYIVSESYGSMEIGGITSSKKFSSDIEFKLVDVPEMGYTSQDKPFPRGELCVKSTTMFSGYHNNAEETKEAFIEGGFFRTGDIVQMEGPESVKIIDRKKFIFKLAQGEYVSPAKSEGVYNKSKFIAQIMAYGNSLQSYLVALIVPNEAILMSWATSHGITNASFQQLCQLSEIKALILNDMRSCELGAQLRVYEKVRDIFVTSELLTPENGLLTATSKLNRRGILNKYKTQLDCLYSSPTALQDADALATSQEIRGDSEALRQLKALVANALPKHDTDTDVTNDMHLAESGMDSMAALKLVKTIEKTMNVSVPISSLYQPGMTVQSLAQVVSHQQGTDEHLREAGATLFEEEINPSVDIDPYNWFPELLPPYKSANQKVNEQKAKVTAQKGLKLEAEKELLKRLHADSEPPKPSGYKSPAPTRPATNMFENIQYRNILLTGATGFLGLYMVKDILDTFPEADVHCIVRASSQQDAEQKLAKALAFAHVDRLDPEMKPGTTKFARIKVVLGDLSRPLFGMPQSQWDGLCDCIDSIYHCATWVNTLFPYQVLRNANVVSTVQLLKMALTGKNKRKAFHYVSTLSSLSRTAGWTPEISISTSAKLFGFEGYPLTKRVCEMLIATVEELIPDLPIVIYRPGSICGHSQTGHVNIEAFIHKMICGLVQFGYYPTSKKWSFELDWAPVDYVSKVIVHISKTGGFMRSNRRYNVSNPYSVYSLTMDRLASHIRSFGYALDPKPLRLWRQDLFKALDDHPGTNLLEPLRGNFEDGFPADSRIECSSTLHSLKAMKKLNENSQNSVLDNASVPVIKCRPISKEQIHAILEFCIEKGYIHPPTRTRTERSASN